MPAKNPMKPWLLMGCVLMTGCLDEVQLDDSSLRAADEQLVAVLQLATNANLQLRWTSDGRAAAVFHRDRSPLFVFENDDPRGRLISWARSNARLLGFTPPDGSTGDTLFSELEFQRRIEAIAPVAPSPGLVVHRYAQRYRGYRVLGPDESVAVSSDGSGGVLSIVGTFVDNRRELAGLRNPISREVAERTVLASVGGDSVLEKLELVAVPERGTMAWAAELSGSTGALLVLLAADTGALIERRELAAESAFDHVPVAQVRGTAMTDDPMTTAEAIYPWLPGSTWTGSYNPLTGWKLRLGDDRALVYDLHQENNLLPTVHLANQFLPGTQVPGSFFTATAASDVFQFNTQNMYQKARTALMHLDALHQPFGWDHAPTSPFGLFTPGPLNLVTNIDTSPEAGELDMCDGALGRFQQCQVQGAAIQPAHPGVTTSCIYACVSRSGVLFHELGHYVDQHATHGVMGSSVLSGKCMPDTTDEAIPLRETLSDVTALYLGRKLYTDLPYDFSTTSTSCTFASLGQGSSRVHDPGCITSDAQIGQFDNDRPSTNPNGACGTSAGYRMTSVNQAVWSWLNGRLCSTQAPYGCTPFRRNPDDFMSGMIYAMGQSNAQSYQTFFENIETYIWVQRGSAAANVFHSIMASHGIVDP
ncbi:hypothetical protein [Hyalangium gracile]|uniref:hypothetical protein n=1 Tax=Hyalangium gracile TaxID=394092 RepID=UPI001CCE2CF5|nr:hypothetical protein [Hyalangium gracile]